jgi:hypothetical protein
MQEDKDLKMLLKEYAFEETSSAFNNAVMQQVAAVPARQSKPLLNGLILKILMSVFIVAFLSLIICLIYFPVNSLPFNISPAFSSSFYSQLFSFITVFWIVMFINIGWNKKLSVSESII